ncbi:MAG: spermidine/putrescine-binding periplasmic protein precursor, partial [Chloroflexota bacterium]|nr:spermidine/putrescine-binding periplasmic protein precursor [Chloroflexota bacterium]
MADKDRELDALIRRMSQTKVHRRGFLAGTGMAGLSAFIAACSPSGGASPSAAASVAPPASAPAGSASPAASAAVEVEPALYMFNWADYVDPGNIEEFKTRFGVTDFTYDTYASNEELLTRLQGGATGQFDVGAPTAEFVEAMVDGDFIQELDWSKIPNGALINKQFQEFYKDDKANLNNYHLPKDWGTTGISIRTKVVKEEVKTWKQFFEVAPKY